MAGRLPGDELIASPTLCTTRAITIDAPADDVWQWLMQMGQDRGPGHGTITAIGVASLSERSPRLTAVRDYWVA